MAQSRQQISFVSFGDRSLADVLALDVPPFTSKAEAHRQLEYVEGYVRDLDCHSLVVEDHYIDRDHMEDHSVFYSKSLQPYPNACRRVHFFSCDSAVLKRELKRLRSTAPPEQFRTESAEFSKRFYLGFTVIKPLPGCPVGRTILRCFAADADKGYLRNFSCACDCRAHLLGVPLSIRGLAFQQQDLGVSACATTALWSALQRARELEEGAAATPAQITMRASQFTLPFGRPMPSEGLSLDQMCQAVHSLGYAPNLYRADTFDVSRGLLYSAVLSGISPVLIIERGDLWHAVAVAGMKVRRPHVRNLVYPLMDDRAGDLAALYIHDDRYGPYLKADIRRKTDNRRKKDRLLLEIKLRNSSVIERWVLSHLLIPLHPKVRLSFGELQRAAIRLVREIHAHRQSILAARETVTSWDCWIGKSHSYVESLILGENRAPESLIATLCTTVPFSRYLGIVRVEADDLDPVDFLLDTTSTERNLHCLALVRPATSRPQTRDLTELLALRYGCSVIG
ncbi:MAG: hypothetical protein JNL98_02185 [Bryobacterales bacterium]|nr:hypothetical protein [Bryobacterales bacterium]